MTFLIRGHAEAEMLSNNGLYAEMAPGGGTMTFRGQDISMTLHTHDLLESLLGVDHLEVEDVDILIVLAHGAGHEELTEKLHVFRANLNACLREGGSA